MPVVGSEPTPAPTAGIGTREWYDANVDAIHGFVSRRIGRDGAPDIVSEVFRIAIERRDAYDPERGSPRAWLYGIATNVLRHHWRTEQRRLRAIGRLDRDAIAPDDSDATVVRLDADGEARRLLDAIERLDPVDRDILTLVAWEGASHGDVSVALDMPIGTVRSRLHRIRTGLRTAMSSPVGRSTAEVHDHG